MASTNVLRFLEEEEEEDGYFRNGLTSVSDLSQQLLDCFLSEGGIGGGDGGPNHNGIFQPISIHLYELNAQNMMISFVETIPTNIRAIDYNTWDELAQSVLTFWSQRNGGFNPSLLDVTPANCWPRGEVIFGVRHLGVFMSCTEAIASNHHSMACQVNSIIVIENVAGFIENGVPHTESSSSDDDDGNVISIRTHVYNFSHVDWEIKLAGQFRLHKGNGAAFESWDEVARRIHTVYLVTNGIDPNEDAPDDDVSVANCWPLAETIFGCRIHSRFQSLNWQHNEWAEVRHQLNSLLVIRYQP